MPATQGLIRDVNIAFQDEAARDAFGRVRVSTPKTIFDSKQLSDKQPLVWDESTSGTGSTAYRTNEASTRLTVTSGTGTAIRQTFQRFNYQPGKSQVIFMTGVIGAKVANVVKRVGYFDANNGLFLEQNGSTVSMVRRSYVSGSAVDEAVAQANWNMDKMDGTGKSGITLDLTKAQILVIDFEWLGVGRARMGFVIGGKFYYVHEFLHANSLTTVYMSTPNLPLRYEISASSSGSGAYMDHICSSVSSEGGVEPNGLLFSASNGVTTKSTGTTLQPLVSIRLKSGQEYVTLLEEVVSVLTTSASANFRWALVLNTSLTGASFASVDTNSKVEADVTATAMTGGTTLQAGYALNDTGITLNPSNARHLGVSLGGTYDTLTLAVQNVAAASIAFLGAISWREVG